MVYRRWRWLGALSIALVVLSGCGGSDADAVSDGDSNAVSSVAATDDDPTEEETTGEDGATGADDVAPEPRDPAEPISVDSVYDAEAEPVMAWFTPFEPGTYRTGAIGTPLTFTTTEPLSTQVNGGGMFVISDIDSRAPDDRDLVFIRVGAFSDPAASNSPPGEQTPWPNDDFLGWLQNLDEGVIATDPVETEVNGFAAVRVDLELADEIECGFIPGSCAGFVENNGHEIKGLNKGASYRVWIIEQGDQDPLAIVDGINRDEDAPWYVRSDAVMDTLAFGDVAPNPVQELVAGENQLDVLGGVRVSLPENLADLTNGRSRLARQWNGRGFAYIPITELPASVEFSDRPHGIEGDPLGSVDDVVAELAAAGVELTELEATTIDGVDARVFDFTSTDVGAIMLRYSPLDVAEDYLGWDAPAAGRLWMITHPDRGLMMISAKAFNDVDELLPVVTTLGDAMVESLTFTP